MARPKKTAVAKKAKKKMVGGKKKKLSATKNLTLRKEKRKAVKKLTAKRKQKVSTQPKGLHSVTPYLIVQQAEQAIKFYQNVFAAKEIKRLLRPDGKIMHAELKIGDAKIMLADECIEMKAYAPQADTMSAVSFILYVKNVDAVVENALKVAGVQLKKPVENTFYGDRAGLLVDPFGHVWCIATHIEDVSFVKLKKRTAQLSIKE